MRRAHGWFVGGLLLLGLLGSPGIGAATAARTPSRAGHVHRTARERASTAAGIAVAGVGTSSSGSGFLTVCATQLCLGGAPFVIKGATAYGQYGDPDAEIAAARSAGLNTLELVEFDDSYHQLSDTEAADTWTTVDRFIAAVAAAHMHVVLNLSEYGQSLQAAGYTMSSPATGSWPDAGWQGDWNQYLGFIANRVNSVTGIRYRNDPTIAMVELWGEIPAPNYPDPVGTTAQLQTFYAASLRRWRLLAPHILASTGGFSYLDDSGSGIPWQAIMGDSADSVCDVEINSTGDRNVSVPEVDQYCQSLGKPWFLAAWSACSQPTQGSWDLDHLEQSTPAATDGAMAAHARDMFDLAAGSSPATYPAIGTDFWNLGPQTWDTCDLGPSSPESGSQTWAVIAAV